MTVVIDSVDAGDAKLVGPPASFEAYAKLVYAAVAAERWDEAESLLASPPASFEQTCFSSSAWEREGLVYGGRAVVNVSTTGTFVSHRTVEGCVMHADAGLTLYVKEKELEATIETNERRSLPLNDTWRGIDVSAHWALLAGAEGAFIALRRSNGEVLRGAYEGNLYPPSARGAPIGGAVSGKYMVIASKPTSRLLYRVEKPEPVAVSGCPGDTLLAVVAASDETVLLQMGDALSVATRLCFVDSSSGRTRRVQPLGTATCGLAGPAPCEWALQVATPTMLGFGSFRGDFKILDARTGGELRVSIPRGFHTEGGSPSHLFECEMGICAAVESDAPANEHVTMAVSRKGNQAVMTPFRRPARPEWCVRGELPVPPPLCTTSAN